MLNDDKVNEIPKLPENQNEQQPEQRVPQTPGSVVRISTRFIDPLFDTLLHCISYC